MKYLDLSERETEVFMQVALGGEPLLANIETYNKLIEKGLLTHHFTVPVNEHIRFCEWCSEVAE